MSDIEFDVDRITDDGLVIGRNGYADVPVGTVFKVLTKTRHEGELSSLSLVDLGGVASVSLRLAEVWHSRRSMDTVPRGHSAGLRLDGDGLDALKHAIATKQPRESIALRVAPKVARSI